MFKNSIKLMAILILISTGCSNNSGGSGSGGGNSVAPTEDNSAPIAYIDRVEIEDDMAAFSEDYDEYLMSITELNDHKLDLRPNEEIEYVVYEDIDRMNELTDSVITKNNNLIEKSNGLLEKYNKENLRYVDAGEKKVKEHKDVANLVFEASHLEKQMINSLGKSIISLHILRMSIYLKKGKS